MGRNSGGGGRGFSGGASFGGTRGTAAATALWDGSIGVSKEQFSKMSTEERRALIAHEVAHHTIDDFVLNNNAEWDRAEAALTARMVGDRRLFIGGNTRVGEAISDAISMHLNNQWSPALSASGRASVGRWASGVIRRAGYSAPELRKGVSAIVRKLESEL